MRTVTKSWEKTLSKLFVLDNQQLSIPSLLLLGTIAGLMYTHLRYPLNIPGHHGLEWMALVMFGRCLSSQRYAATILATGAVAGYLAQIPLLSLTNEFKPVFVFLISGFFADTIYRQCSGKLPHFISIALTGGLAFITKPTAMYFLFLTANIKVGMFLKHPDYLPFISHFMFGALGAIGGAMLAKATMSMTK